MEKMMEKHHHLRDFLNNGNAEIFLVKTILFLFLEGVLNAHFQGA